MQSSYVARFSLGAAHAEVAEHAFAEVAEHDAGVKPLRPWRSQL